MSNKLNKFNELMDLIDDERDNCDEFFQEYIANYNVIINDETAIMYRLVKYSNMTEALWFEGETDGEPDTLLIDYVVGSLDIFKTYITILPYGINKVCFLKHEKPHVYLLERFWKEE